MDELISVIVPIFNVEEYLEQCIESIVNQSYKNLEIILVDDESPDNCPVLCDQWAKKDPRIRVIHKENGGLSDARNAGMTIAKGELIGFVDGDDWISQDMYKLLHDKIILDGCDIAAGGVIKVYEDGRNEEKLTSEFSGILSKEEAMCALISETDIKQPVWYKLYKKSILKDILFATGKCHEDVFWSYQVFGNANRIGVISTPCYYYRQRKRSIMSQRYSLKRLDILEAKVLRQEYLEKEMPALVSVGKCDLIFSCIYHMQASLATLSKREKSQALIRILNIKKRYHFSKNDVRQLDFKQKIWAFLSEKFFVTTCKLRNILKVGI